MGLNDDELKYKNVIDTLKGLPQIKAPQNFEADLMRRINSEKYEEKQSFWQKIFLPSRLIPSAGLAVAAVLLLFIVNINSDEVENPLLMEPKVREDIIEADDISDIPMNEKETGEDRLGKQEGSVSELRDEVSDTGMQGNRIDLLYSTYSIDRSGLNFRQVTLSDEEKQRLNELKKHFIKLLENSRNN